MVIDSRNNVGKNNLMMISSVFLGQELKNLFEIDKRYLEMEILFNKLIENIDTFTKLGIIGMSEKI